jgi:hypothetical protein
MNNYKKLLTHLAQYHSDGKYYLLEEISFDMSRQSLTNIVNDLKKDDLIDVKEDTGKLQGGISFYLNIGGTANSGKIPLKYVPFKARITRKGFNQLELELASDTKKVDEKNKISNLKSTVESLLERGKTGDAIECLLTEAKNHQWIACKKELILLSNRFSCLETTKNSSIGYHENMKVEQNQLNVALLSLLDTLEL